MRPHQKSVLNAVTNAVPISKRNLTKVSCERSKKFTHLNIKFSRLIRKGLFASFNIPLVIAEAASRIKNLQKIKFLKKLQYEGIFLILLLPYRLDIRKGVFRERTRRGLYFFNYISWPIRPRRPFLVFFSHHPFFRIKKQDFDYV
jgi:hypothetical protein